VDGLAGIIPFVLIALVFWLLIVRPQRRRAQLLRDTQTSLGIGTEVMLGSGIYGTVASLDDDTTILVEVAPGTILKVARQAVVRVVEPAGPEDETAPDGPLDDRDDLDDGAGGGTDHGPGTTDQRP
jgi:preprotein translocase subunit YajC